MSTNSSIFASTSRALTLGACTILLSTLATNAFAQANPARFVSFNEFIDNTKSTAANDLLRRPESNAKEPVAIEEMRKAILDRYNGVKVTHSFLPDGQHYDCVPLNQQPAFRTYG